MFSPGGVVRPTDTYTPTPEGPAVQERLREAFTDHLEFGVNHAPGTGSFFGSLAVEHIRELVQDTHDLAMFASENTLFGSGAASDRISDIVQQALGMDMFGLAAPNDTQFVYQSDGIAQSAAASTVVGMFVDVYA
jgi:hypothetical protein